MTGERGKERKVLVVQEARFGDLIQSRPLLEALSDGGECRRVLLVRTGVAEAARSLCLAEEVRVWPPFGNPEETLSLVARLSLGRAFISELRSEGFERVVVLNHHGTGVTLSRHLGIPVSGFDRLFDRKNDLEEPDFLRGWPGYLVASSRGVRAINRIHLSDMWLGFAGGTGRGAEDRVGSSGLPAKTNLHGPVVVVLGGRSPYRRWEKEALGKLILSLRRIDGGPVILSGGPEDEPLGELLARECGDGVENTAGKTNYPELATLLSGAGVVVSPDTAALHLAAGLGVPTVGLFFASALPFETGAYRTGALSLATSLDCYPCAGEGSSCAHLSCRNAPDPGLLSEIVSSVRRGATGKDLAAVLSGRMAGVELWEAEMTASGLLQKVLTPRPVTKERILSRLLRRFSWRYLDETTNFPSLEGEIAGEGQIFRGDPAGTSFEPVSEISVWFSRLERGIDLYSRLREKKIQKFERRKMVDRLSSEFPMIWPILHHLEGVEGGGGDDDRAMRALGHLARETSEAFRQLIRERNAASCVRGSDRVAV